MSFTVKWDEHQDDTLVQKTLRRKIEQIEAFSRANNTGYRYRYSNYCAEWQKSFEGYSEENLRFLQEVSRNFDYEELFQTGCTGSFKLTVGS